MMYIMGEMRETAMVKNITCLPRSEVKQRGRTSESLIHPYLNKDIRK